MLRLLAAALAACLVNAPLPALAADPPAVQWLRERPASLWDLGLFKVNAELQGLGFADGTALHAYAQYNYDEGAILVSGRRTDVYQPAKRTRAQAQELCAEAIRVMKAALGAPAASEDPRLTRIALLFEPARAYGARGSQVAMGRDIADYLVGHTRFSATIAYGAAPVRMADCNAAYAGDAVIQVPEPAPSPAGP